MIVVGSQQGAVEIGGYQLWIAMKAELSEREVEVFEQGWREDFKFDSLLSGLCKDFVFTAGQCPHREISLPGSAPSLARVFSLEGDWIILVGESYQE